METCPFYNHDNDGDDVTALLDEYFNRPDDDSSQSECSDTDDSDTEDDIDDDGERCFQCLGYDRFIAPLNHEFASDTDEESKLITKFIEQKCRCVRSCSDVFSADELRIMRAESKALDYNENNVNRLDVAILSELRALTATGTDTVSSKKTSKERERVRTKFLLRGLAVCRDMFLFVHGISDKRFRKIQGIFLADGLVEKMHGNAKRIPHNSLAFVDTENVVTCIRNYAQQNALFLPGRQAGVFNSALKLLPTSDTKKTIFYDVYKPSCEIAGVKDVSLVSFRKLWKTFCPEIVISKPKWDLCKFCQKNYTSVNREVQLDDEEKRKVTEDMTKHLNNVAQEREYYNNVIANTKVKLKEFTDTEKRKIIEQEKENCIVGFEENCIVDGKQNCIDEEKRNAADEERMKKITIQFKPDIPNSYSGAGHHSFDMAQLVSLPHNPYQPGPVYFLTGFKVCIFGIMNDTLQRQYNYLIPESVSINKSSSYIVSMLHHYFNNFAIGEKILNLHADNCCWQNKNFTLMSYLNYRVMTGMNETITISYMPPGHTKFSCDWAFGLFKKKFRITEAYTLQHVKSIVENSTPQTKINQCVLTSDEKGINCFVDFYKWIEYFENLKWKKIPKISTYYHFTFSKEKPGYVMCRETLNHDFQEYLIGDIIPPEIELKKEEPLSGLSYERQKYLYENFREYVPNQLKDILCPEPVSPEPVKKKEECSEEGAEGDAPGPKKRGRPKKSDTPCPAEVADGPCPEPNISGSRKRGRPKKKDIVQPEEVVGDDVRPEPVIPSQKKRGRPKNPKYD